MRVKSCGLYYSFGLKGNFGKVGDSSISQYAIKNGKSIEQQLNSAIIEEMLHRELCDGVNTLERIIPRIRNAISPLIGCAHKLQKEYGDINIRETASASLGIWKTAIAVNAYTQQLHYEDDCTYTIIHVPNQEGSDWKNRYHFQFHLDEKLNIAFVLNPSLTIMFAAPLLTHRQTYDSTGLDDSTFISFGAYGNRRLFNHIRKSFMRKDNN